jgi:hypothetical protein
VHKSCADLHWHCQHGGSIVSAAGATAAKLACRRLCVPGGSSQASSQQVAPDARAMPDPAPAHSQTNFTCSLKAKCKSVELFMCLPHPCTCSWPGPEAVHVVLLHPVHQRVYDHLLHHRVVGVDCVAAAAPVDELRVLAGVRHVVHRAVDAPVVVWQGWRWWGGRGRDCVCNRLVLPRLPRACNAEAYLFIYLLLHLPS